jgi:hypothetical protein
MMIVGLPSLFLFGRSDSLGKARPASLINFPQKGNE